jgi:guanine deaminase
VNSSPSTAGTSLADLRLRGPLLLPVEGREDAFVYHADGVVVTDARGVVAYAGAASAAPGGVAAECRSVGLLTPPLADCHIHVPQHPIRGRFVEGVPFNAPGGQLLAGLARNVYPAEARCADLEHALSVSGEFLRETRAGGTHGGVAYMTSHPLAARAALQTLPVSWRVGLVLMDQNCPPALSISPSEALVALEGLARDFGQRLVVTDRFAVACSSRLRVPAADLAKRLGLDTQTHLAEQPGELETVHALYPDVPHYTAVYDRDGLLACGCIVAHCIHLTDDEWSLLARRGARVAHCPVSNTLLGSGVMPLDAVYRHRLDYALCTDVGASPSTSLLTEMTHFLSVHAGRSAHATPSTALFRCTVAAKRVGRLDLGGLTPGNEFAATEFHPPSGTDLPPDPTADDVIRAALLGPLHADIPAIDQATKGRVVRLWGR